MSPTVSVIDKRNTLNLIYKVVKYLSDDSRNNIEVQNHFLEIYEGLKLVLYRYSSDEELGLQRELEKDKWLSSQQDSNSFLQGLKNWLSYRRRLKDLKADEKMRENLIEVIDFIGEKFNFSHHFIDGDEYIFTANNQSMNNMNSQLRCLLLFAE